jgi:predicted amidohydrolase YtcJ
MHPASQYFTTISLLTLGLAACSPADTPASAPDAVSFTEPVRIFTADTIYTGNPDEPQISGLAVNAEGRIVATFPLGSEAKAITPDGPADIIKFDGATLFPGFVDGHAHLRGIGQRELTLDLSGTASIDALTTHIEAVVFGAPVEQVFYGRGWIETGWPEGRMPNAADLDKAAPNNPVILTRADGHALVANSAAMAAAGITNVTANPAGGAIERDATGAATGIFVDNAMGLITSLIAAPSEADIATALETGAEVYASRGWTGLHNMSVAAMEAPIMEALDDAGRLPIRVHNAFDTEGFDIAAARAHETDTVQNRAVKIYMDGALGSRGALLFEPYTDRPDTSGLALSTEEDTIDLLVKAYNANVQIAFHAIGDKANSDALTWMNEAALKAGASDDPAARDHRWRVEHAQIVRPDDLGLFANAGNILASMQPSHAIGDFAFAPDRLGLDRLAGAYAWQSVLDKGGMVIGGSDAPVEVGSPLIEFYAAVARKALDGSSGDGWHPEEAVSRQDALAMFTSAPAFASFQEDDLGTLRVGKIADLSAFDADLMTIAEADILTTDAVATIVAGKIVWQRD